MKKILSLMLLLMILTSCWKEVIDEIPEVKAEKTTYQVWTKEDNFLNIYWNIVNSTSKIINPNISWKITFLSCEPWKKVWPQTLIASISPNEDWQAFQNSSIQANSIIDQIKKLNEIKQVTIDTFEVQKKQINLQREELSNSRANISENIWNDSAWIQNQLKILNDSIDLLKKNQAEAETEIENQTKTLKKNIYNSLIKASKRIDETFWITDKNINFSSNYEIYLWAGNNIWKSEVKNSWKTFIEFVDKLDENLKDLSEEDILKKLQEFSKLFKTASDVIKESMASDVYLPQAKIDWLFTEFLSYSDGFITLENNYDKLINSRQTTKTNFDMKLKELESKKSTLNSEESNLKNKENSVNISEKNIDEQLSSIEETKKAKLKEIDLQILSAEQNLKSVSVTLKSENLYAETSWIIKQKLQKAEWAQVQVWTPICEIIPDKNSLKLEIYSPERLKVGDKFNYYKDSKQIWSWEIIAEYPEKTAQTQNYIYEWKINFWELKQGEYLDIKVLRKATENEIWVDLKYVSPKLDWYYVKKVVDWKATNQKVETWNMNNWKIQITSGLANWDLLEE